MTHSMHTGGVLGESWDGGAVASLPVGPRWNQFRAVKRSSAVQWLLLLLLHAPLMMAIKASPMIATAHALGTLAVGIRSLRSRSPERVLYVMGYLVASEPMWRLGKAMIFYETAKYALAGLSILAISKFRLARRTDKTALLFFLLLLPSILVLPDFDRREISFNMSGPFSLAMSVLFLSSVRLTQQVLQRLFLTILAPILGFAFVASVSTFTTENIDFYSTKIAAGGLGNNQASSILGLGALIAFLYVCAFRRPLLLRRFVTAAGLWCGVQGALTFSRGGIAAAIGAIATVSFFLLRDRKSRSAVVVRVGLIALIVAYLAVPFLNTVTTGTFQTRFSSTRLTGRDKIIEGDMIAFRENPVLGVGPGKSKDYHALTFRRSSTHTEYSRLLAEHGLLGLAALMLMAWMSLKRLFRPSPTIGKAFAAGLTAWALLFMFHAAMRMAAASFIFALGAAYLMAEIPIPDLVRHRGRTPLPPTSRTR